MAPNKPGFFEELKRRHVVRVAIAYAVAGWLIVQIATQVFPFFNIPTWAVRLVVILIVIGFPVAVVLAWVYELTPEGIRRTESADALEARSEHAQRDVGRKLNAVIIAVLALAVALLGWRLYAVRHVPGTSRVTGAAGSPARPQERSGSVAQGFAAGMAASGLSRGDISAPAASIPEKSVAVLPFDNESGIEDQQFFSDGLSEDLINALSQFSGLKVISRNSAFQFRNSKDDSAEVGRKLGVAHLLEGSVRRAGNEVRISAELVKAADGTILWSQHYDRPYRDLFTLQDDITQSVATALKAKLLTAPGAMMQSDRPPGGDLDAYTAYLRGVSDRNLNTGSSLRDGIAAFGDAVRLDPKYAAAYAQLSIIWTDYAAQYLGGSKAKQAYATAHAASDTALALDPDLAVVHLARARVLQVADLDWTSAEAETRRALQLAPNDVYAKFFLGNISAALGRAARAVDLTQQALQADPRDAVWYSRLASYLAAQDRLDEAAQAANTSIGLQPGAAAFRERLAIIEVQRGDPKAALAAARQETEEGWRDVAMALALQIGANRNAADAALKKLIAQHNGDAAYQIAQVYALRGDPDNMYKWLDRAWSNRDPGIAYLLFDPLILRYKSDPRFAAFCKKVGLPTTTDAVAMK